MYLVMLNHVIIHGSEEILHQILALLSAFRRIAYRTLEHLPAAIITSR